MPLPSMFDASIRGMQRRLDLIQVDDEAKQRKVQKARDLILKKNHAVASNKVEALLKAQSLTPTAVSEISSSNPH